MYQGANNNTIIRPWLTTKQTDANGTQNYSKEIYSTRDLLIWQTDSRQQEAICTD